MAGKKRFADIIEGCPVIPAARDMDTLRAACESDCEVLFVLFGDVLSIADIVLEAKEAGKIILVHMDMVSGLARGDISIDFMKRQTLCDGIISTKQVQIKRAMELDLYTVHRFFAIDSAAYSNVERCVKLVRPDSIELMPGIMPKVINRLCRTISVPVIAGGLISDKQEIMAALSAGAAAVSTSSKELWSI